GAAGRGHRLHLQAVLAAGAAGEGRDHLQPGGREGTAGALAAMTPPPPPDGEYFRLRAEWLRFKNHVFDTNTGLPTLAAVLDDVRRLMEERGTLSLVYIDLGAEGHVEPVHGWQAYDELLRAFARTLLSLRESGQLGPRDIIAVMAVRADKFLVFMRGGEGTSVDAAAAEARTRRLRARILEALPAHLGAGAEVPVF